MNPHYDIVFDRENFRFNYRVVGIGLDKGRVLLQQIKRTDWWFMPGGRGTIGETAGHTLKREMKEELDAEVEVGRLVWIVENFFEMDSRFWHELAMFFLIKFPEDSPVLTVDEISGTDTGAAGDPVSVINRWHRLDGIAELPLYPSFLRAGLRNIPDATQCIVCRDGRDWRPAGLD